MRNVLTVKKSVHVHGNFKHQNKVSQMKWSIISRSQWYNFKKSVIFALDEKKVLLLKHRPLYQIYFLSRSNQNSGNQGRI